MSGRRFRLVVDIDDSLDDVAKEGINEDQQQLLQNGINLANDKVEKLNISYGAVLFLTLRNRER